MGRGDIGHNHDSTFSEGASAGKLPPTRGFFAIAVDEEETDADIAEKRLAIRLRWRDRSGGWERPVRAPDRVGVAEAGGATRWTPEPRILSAGISIIEISLVIGAISIVLGLCGGLPPRSLKRANVPTWWSRHRPPRASAPEGRCMSRGLGTVDVETPGRCSDSPEETLAGSFADRSMTKNSSGAPALLS